MDVSIILVNYKTKELTINAINSVIEKTEGINYEIIIVDNDSNDGSIEAIEQTFPQLNIIKSKINGGFGYANNLAIKQAKGKLDTINTDNKNIMVTGYISDDDLATLYKNALLFVMPSFEEGFGIPIIEAQYAKTPVLCSDISVFREICGNSAEFVIPNAEQLAKKIELLINDENKRNELIKLGQYNVKRFNNNIMEKQLMDIIGKVGN